MKALSIMQPWASLIVGGPYAPGVKRVENRTWNPPASMIGAQFAIHASKKLDMDAFNELHDGAFGWKRSEWMYGTPAQFPRSAIVGIATLDRVVLDPHSLTANEARFWAGPIGFVLRDVRRIDPIADVKGALGFWALGPDVASRVEEQLR
jgi:hypothetical protein